MKKIYILLGLLALIGKLSYGQLSEGGRPFSPGAKLKSGITERIIGIKKPNIDSLLNSCELTGKKRDIAAVAVDLDLDILKRAESWKYQQGIVYELALQTPDASGLIVHFSEFHLPAGAKVFVYNDNTVLGAYTSNNNKSFGSLTLQEIEGSEATIQLFIPDGKENQVKLRIGNIGYGFTESMADGDGGSNLFGASLSCNYDINSKMGLFHQKEKYSVVLMIHLEYAFYVRYSAVLVNNYKQDGTPYFLTAKHCFEKVFSNREFHPEYAETAVAHFNYESSVPEENGDWTQAISGAEILCYDPSEEAGYYDLVLIRFNETPPEEFKPYYAGVKSAEAEVKDLQYNSHFTQGNISYSVIHHPVGDVKKITWYERMHNMNEMDITLKDNFGVTEGGSSGSPLFDQDHYVVGVLSAGTGGNIVYDCESDFSDIYTLLEPSKVYLNEVNTYLFGESESRTVEPYVPYADTSRLIFFPSSIKIDHDEETLLCKNASTSNYSNFRWDFGTGAEPQTFTGAEPPGVMLMELGYYKVILTALNSNTGQDETFVADSIIQCRYGKPYPSFTLTDKRGQFISQEYNSLYRCEYTDSIYVYNHSYGAVDSFVFLVGGDNPYTITTTSKDDIIVLPPFGEEVLQTVPEYSGKELTVSLKQIHQESDTTQEMTLGVYEPTVADFRINRVNHFGREMPDDYYLLNEVEAKIENRRSGWQLREKWFINDVLEGSWSHRSNFSVFPTEPGLYEVKLFVYNDFSSDTKSVSFDYHLTVGVDDIVETKLQVYPTLCHDKVTIQSPLESMQLSIFDITGKLIQQQTLYAGQETINTSSLNRGIYLFNFISNKRKRTIKIIKQ